MSYEYIASGLSFIWKRKFDNDSDPMLVKEIRKMIDNMTAQYTNHKFGVLFNGLTEKHQGPHCRSVFDPYTIQVDSGGLQMVTLGKKSGPADKDEVYRTQAQWGDIGMSFDTMPLKLINDRSTFHDTNSRFFDPSILEDCAVKSGKDLARQIEVFIEEKTKCRPFMIIQGGSLEYYQQWADIVLQQVPQNHWKYIAGISSGAGALGQGLKEDVERVFVLSQLDLPSHMLKRFHLLGFGSMSRLIPVIQMKRSGLFSEDIHFTYDSTKHTRSCVNGQYQLGKKIIQLSRSKDKHYHKAFQLIEDVCENVFDHKFDEDLFFNTIIMPGGEYTKKFGADHMASERNLATFAFFLYSVNEVMKAVKLMEDDETKIAEIRKQDYNAFLTLSKIKDVNQFYQWKNEYGKTLNSKAVKNLDEHSSLEAFL